MKPECRMHTGFNGCSWIFVVPVISGMGKNEHCEVMLGTSEE